MKTEQDEVSRPYVGGSGGQAGPRGESENEYLFIAGLKTYWTVDYKEQDFHHAIETPLDSIQLKCGPMGK